MTAGYYATPQLCGSLPLASKLGATAVRSLLLIGVVSSFATKLGDTFASEIGKAYGKTTYLITTLRKVLHLF